MRRLIFITVPILILGAASFYAGIVRQFEKAPSFEEELRISQFISLGNTAPSQKRDQIIQSFLDQYKFDKSWRDCRSNLTYLSQGLIFLRYLEFRDPDMANDRFRLACDNPIILKLHIYYQKIGTDDSLGTTSLGHVADILTNQEPSTWRYFLLKIGLLK